MAPTSQDRSILRTASQLFARDPTRLGPTTTTHLTTRSTVVTVLRSAISPAMVGVLHAGWYIICSALANTIRPGTRVDNLVALGPTAGPPWSPRPAATHPADTSTVVTWG